MKLMNHSDVLIIGAGLSGLSCAHFLNKNNPSLTISILERAGRVGGVIDSALHEGFLAEYGPHGFLDNKPESQTILRDLQLESLVKKAPLADFKRYICKGGKLLALPQKPQELMTSPLLSLFAKIRLLAEPFIKPVAGTPTVREWAKARFGSGVLPLVDAAVTGTFSGDYARLSMDAVMPGVRQVEKEYGSLIKGLAAKKKKKDKGGLPAMVNFPDGMVTLVDRLAAGKNILLEHGVTGVEEVQDGWRVTTEKGLFSCTHLVCALSMNGGLQLLSQFSPPVARIPESTICNVVLGFEDSGFLPKAFGYLAPERENRFVLGCMFTTKMFSGRAPDGYVLLEALVGGRRHPERLSLQDDELIDLALKDLGQLLSLPGKPVFSKVMRPKGGIPQLEKDHLDLLRWRTTLQQDHPGLHICGFGWDGIGINDATKSANDVAMSIVGGGSAKEEVGVKPVYF